MSVPVMYEVEARNLSAASENRIHDDDVARRFGFRGGLVPGVEVYAYMTHLPVARWGRAWLERGTAECRFMKPVYDGRVATVSVTETDGVLALKVESEGETCANGKAALPETAATASQLPEVASVPAHDDRPDADEATLPVGRPAFLASA